MVSVARGFVLALLISAGYSLQAHLGADENPIRCHFFDDSSRLGSGFSSEVFKCDFRVAPNKYRPVAVKKFKPTRVGDLVTEIDVYLKLMKRINNPQKFDAFFVRALGVVSQSGTLYQPLDSSVTMSSLDLSDLQWLVMEYCPGKELFEVRLSSSLDFKTYLQYFRYLTAGASVMHDAQIIHRDLKIENVMMCPSSTVSNEVVPKIIDFGFATDLASEDKVKLEKSLERRLGTYYTTYYESSSYFPHYDVFTLGVNLWRSFLNLESFPSLIGQYLGTKDRRATAIPSTPCLEYLKTVNRELLNVYGITESAFGDRYASLTVTIGTMFQSIVFKAMTPVPKTFLSSFQGSTDPYTAFDMGSDLDKVLAVIGQESIVPEFIPSYSDCSNDESGELGHLEMDLLSTNPVRCSFFDMSTRIGSGVASDVFKCKMRLADGNYQAVTVKKFKPGYEDDISDEVDMYLKLMERVTDTNKLDAFFVRILGIVSDSGTMYQPCDGLMDPSTLDLTDPQWIVMEYCSGGELFEQRAKHSMDFTTYLQYFRYLTNGVSVLHDARILHRNLKLENVNLCTTMESERLVPKIMDFRFALDLATGDKDSLIHDLQAHTGSYLTSFAESAAYPEHIDVFALGANLWRSFLNSRKFQELVGEYLGTVDRRPRTIPSAPCLEYLQRSDRRMLNVYGVTEETFGEDFMSLSVDIATLLHTIIFKTMTPVPSTLLSRFQYPYSALDMVNDLDDVLTRVNARAIVPECMIPDDNYGELTCNIM